MTYYERRLPHWQPEGRALFITWRLRDAAHAVARARTRLKREAAAARGQERGQECPRHPPAPGECFALMDLAMDSAEAGSKWLSDPRAADALVETLRRGACELKRHRLPAFVVMPNHVHILIEPLVEVVQPLKAIKGSAAHAINGILGRTGLPLWQDESFDHWVRSAAGFERIRAYIENNPVRAGLVSRPEDWPWSSANPKWRHIIAADTD